MKINSVKVYQSSWVLNKKINYSLIVTVTCHMFNENESIYTYYDKRTRKFLYVLNIESFVQNK